jgi:hypothetical protein
VRVGEGCADGFDHTEGLLRGKRAACEAGLEGFTLDELHHQVGLPLVFGEVVDRNDVGVFEFGHHPRFAGEPCCKGRILAERRMQDLDGHVSVEAGVVRLIDRRHSTLAELLQDAVRAHILTVGERHFTSPRNGFSLLPLSAAGPAGPSFTRPIRKRAPNPWPDLAPSILQAIGFSRRFAFTYPEGQRYREALSPRGTPGTRPRRWKYARSYPPARLR